MLQRLHLEKEMKMREETAAWWSSKRVRGGGNAAECVLDSQFGPIRLSQTTMWSAQFAAKASCSVRNKTRQIREG